MSGVRFPAASYQRWSGRPLLRGGPVDNVSDIVTRAVRVRISTAATLMADLGPLQMIMPAKTALTLYSSTRLFVISTDVTQQLTHNT